MVKYRIQHTHPNPKKGRDQPLLIIIDGPKESCQECQEIEAKRAAKRLALHQVRKKNLKAVDVIKNKALKPKRKL
jgi:hypothetical protein